MDADNFVVRRSFFTGKVKILIGYAWYPACEIGTWRQQYTVDTIGL